MSSKRYRLKTARGWVNCSLKQQETRSLIFYRSRRQLSKYHLLLQFCICFVRCLLCHRCCFFNISCLILHLEVHQGLDPGHWLLRRLVWPRQEPFYWQLPRSFFFPAAYTLAFAALCASSLVIFIVSTPAILIALVLASTRISEQPTQPLHFPRALDTIP